jgi:hypothetical protein
MRGVLEEKIAASGQVVQVVRPLVDDPSPDPPFMYTIGNHAHALPELLIIGTDHDSFVHLLNRLGRLQRDRGRGFADEELVDIGNAHPLRMVDAGSVGRNEYATFVGLYYSALEYEVRQVLLPDSQGRWPDTPGCDVAYARQRVLSKVGRSTH